MMMVHGKTKCEEKVLTIEIKFVWFDLGYTLVHLNREDIYRELLKEEGIQKSKEELVLAFHLTDKLYMREKPGALALKDEQTMQDYYRDLNHLLSIQSVNMLPKRIIRKPSWRSYSQTIPTLTKLKDAGIGVGLISNWDHTARDVLQATNILPLLDEVVISSEVGIDKPDARIFSNALERIPYQADECLYVGDNYYDDVVGSRQVGMPSTLINPFGVQGIEELQNIQIISDVGQLFSVISPTNQIIST